MNKIQFIKDAAGYYKSLATALVSSLIPNTSYETYYARQLGYTQFLTVRKTWLGQVLEETTFELADTPEKKELLAELLAAEKISQKEYEKYLSPLKDQK